MTISEILVLIGGIGLIIFILWFFFGKKEAGEAKVSQEKQEVTIVVEGSYSPSEITVKKGISVEITFDRRESGDCSEWVIISKLKVSHFVSRSEASRDKQSSKLKVEEKEIRANLAPFAKTKIEFTPMESGEFPFSCGMGMLHGKLIVK